MKRILALCLALLLGLSSCAAVLEREYTVTAAHVENPPPQGDTAYRVETYPALRSALLSYVEEGLDAGLLRFPTTYEGNLSVDLEKARRQLMEVDPLGNYALSDLTFHISKIIAYYEVSLTFSYRVDRSQLTALRRVSGREELTALLGEALESFERELTVYLTDYPEGDDRFFAALLSDAYDAHPAAALGRPELDVQLYPKSGSRRVAQLTLRYPRNPAALLRQKSLTAQALDALVQDLGPAPDAQDLFTALKARCAFDPQAGATVYDALVGQSANSEGLSLAYAALCRRSGLACRVVRLPEGCWVALAVQDGGAELFLDPTAQDFTLLEALPAAQPRAAGEGEEHG